MIDLSLSLLVLDYQQKRKEEEEEGEGEGENGEELEDEMIEEWMGFLYESFAVALTFA